MLIDDNQTNDAGKRKGKDRTLEDINDEFGGNIEIRSKPNDSSHSWDFDLNA